MLLYSNIPSCSWSDWHVSMNIFAFSSAVSSPPFSGAAAFLPAAFFGPIFECM